MTESDQKFVVFYSWQSDLPKKANQNFLRTALRTASTKFEDRVSNHSVEVDEATRGVPGSPNIPLTILEKIRTCDVFVCDISTINDSAPTGLRRTPNPNVAFELGYAIANLGWGRVVLLFNDAFGSLKDVPFDFDRHRILKYTLADNDPNKRAVLEELSATLALGMSNIAIQNPERPTFGALPLAEQTRRDRDISNLRWILSAVHFPSVDHMIDNLPHLINHKAIDFWEDFNGVYTNSLFHVYDKELAKILGRMHTAWEICVSNGHQYHVTSNPTQYVFANPNQAPFSKEQERIWKKINKARRDLQDAVKELLKRVRKKYLEVEVDQTNQAAWTRYLKEQEEIHRNFSALSKPKND